MSERSGRIHIVLSETAPRSVQNQMHGFRSAHPGDISVQVIGKEPVGRFTDHVEAVVVASGDGRNQDVRQQLENQMRGDGTAPAHIVAWGGSEMGFRKTLVKERTIVTMEDLLERNVGIIPGLHAGELAGNPFTVTSGVGKVPEGVTLWDEFYRNKSPRNIRVPLTMIHAYLQALASNDAMDPATEMYFIAEQVDPLPPFKEQRLHNNPNVTKLSIEGDSKSERAIKLALFFAARALFRSRFPTSLATITSAPEHMLDDRYTKINVDGQQKDRGDQEPVVRRSALAIPTAALIWKR